jgi:hypothetical protein
MFEINNLSDECKNEDISLEEKNSKNNNKKEIEKKTIIIPEYSATVFKYLNKDKLPRKWFIQMISSPWFERVSMFVIIINCITLGMYKPCEDQLKCTSTRCFILEYLDHSIYIFFIIEMMIKIIAMGLYGKNTYLSESWNILDFLIILAG